jgi:DNA mismatch repair ATPase MutS
VRDGVAIAYAVLEYFCKTQVNSTGRAVFPQLASSTICGEEAGPSVELLKLICSRRGFSFFVQAHIFFATHFQEICGLDIYPNACNYHFQTYLSKDHRNKADIVYSHRLVEGPTPEKDYGIQLAQRIGFPAGLIKAAQFAMEQLRSDFYDVRALEMTRESIVRRLKKQLIQSLKRVASQEQMPASQK